MKHSVKMICLATAMLTGTVAVAAGQNQMMGGGMDAGFERIDTDGDGRITQAEMDAHHKARFDAADANGDGSLTRDEMMAQAQKRAERRVEMMLKRHDADGDGALSPDEMGGMRKGRMFDRMDTDGDGAITKAEFDAAHQGHGKRHKRDQRKAD